MAGALLALCVCLAGCGTVSGQGQKGAATEQKLTEEGIPYSSRDIFAMDTYMTITGYGDRADEAVDASLEEIRRLDALLSVGNPDSEVSVINKTGTGPVSEETAKMVEEALEIGDRTEGKFDITIYPLMEEWGFTSDQFRVPEKGRLEQLLDRVDYRELRFDSNAHTVTLGEGQGMDLGGIAKGFTSDRVMEIFREYGLVSGVVSLGGNVACFQSKTDGSQWRCGIRDPNTPDEATLMGIVSVTDRSVITSGAYERNFTDPETGKLYHHILDPATGYSAESGLISVSIISKNGMLADGLSTSMYILGLEGATEYWKQYGEDFDMVLMTKENQIYITEGIKDQFKSEYPVHVIEK